ncbi:Hypothetical predicted protein, partial [Pelobates cultripes]
VTHPDNPEAHNHPHKQQPSITTYPPVKLRHHHTNSGKSYSLPQTPMHTATTLHNTNLELPSRATHPNWEIMPPANLARPYSWFPTPRNSAAMRQRAHKNGGDTLAHKCMHYKT